MENDFIRNGSRFLISGLQKTAFLHFFGIRLCISLLVLSIQIATFNSLKFCKKIFDRDENFA